MSDFDWSNFQKLDAHDAARLATLKSRGFLRANTLTEEARQLTKICDEMSESYAEAVAEEQTLYEIEMEEASIEDLEKELEDKITRMKELESRQKDGTITEEEKTELASLSSNIKVLNNQLVEKIRTEIELSHGLSEDIKEEKTVRETALEYSDRAIDDGETLIGRFARGFRKFLNRIFGIGHRDIKIGEGAIASGANLEAVVKVNDIARDLEKTIASAENTTEAAQSLSNDAENVVAETNVDADAVVETPLETEGEESKKELEE